MTRRESLFPTTECFCGEKLGGLPGQFPQVSILGESRCTHYTRDLLMMLVQRPLSYVRLNRRAPGQGGERGECGWI